MQNNEKKRVPGLKQAQTIIYFALILVIGSMGYGLYYNLDGMSDMIVENERVSTDFTSAVLHLKSAFGYTGFIHNFKNYVLRGTPKYLDLVKFYYDEITMSLDHLKDSSVVTENDLKVFAVIRKTADDYMDAALMIQPMVVKGDSVKAIDSIVKIDDSPARDALARLDIRYREIISNGSDRISKKLSTTLYSFLLIIIISVIIFVVLLIYVFHRLDVQVKAIGKVSKDMAEGDLSKEITIIPNDAIGDMAENFNLAIASLKKIIGGVVTTTNEGRNLNDTLSGRITQIEISSGEMSNNLEGMHEKIKEENNQIIEASSALEEISANTSSLSKQIGMQAESVSTTSAAVEEMAASILNVARVADARQNVTESLIKMTKEGSEKIEEANVIVQDAVKNMGAMQEMLEVINNITSQTNLLSMNAAIEAAHAGDAGKGFAVVADEIRKLAESTAENAHDISDSLTVLINRINETANVTKESGDSFRNIEVEVRNFVQAFAEISASTKELSEGSKEIQDSTISLLEITSNIKTGAEEITLGANDINIALLRIKDTSDNNTSGMAMSREQIGDIHSAMTDISVLSATNTENMNTLLEEVSVFTLDSTADSVGHEELGVGTVDSDQ
ncbi:MAG: hypothetical protein KAQ93_06175 [Spirochaetales bacterium]|nr:hypothetical protein [Spirochaetales bacterium]